jgi:cytochrome c biogenesis protein CcmG/thiol:disulfide interchange protein DsbE
MSGGDLLGKASPDIRLNGDGKDIALSSFRGKPVFIDFWATSCGPCLDMMGALKTLYKEIANKDLVWMSIDSDDDAGTAAAFIKQEQIPWPNYHDADGSLGKPFGRWGIPLGVLIDRDGKVAFYKVGYDLAELRAAIAKLGPDFAGVAGAPPEKPSPPANQQPQSPAP